MGNVVVGLVLAVCVALAIRYLYRQRKSGRCVGCSGCQGGAGCHCHETPAQTDVK